MRLIKKFLEKDKSGQVTMRPEEPEDMWHAYNLISEGDELRATAVRRIVSESATGSTDSKRIKLNLTIRVDKVVFSAAPAQPVASTSSEPAALTAPQQDEGATLHVSGPVVQESQHVKMGAFHTLDLELNRDFTLRKGPGGWDSIAMERVTDATNAIGGAEVGAIVCGDGIANICLITQHTTIVRQRIEVPVPRKRKGGGTALGAEKATSRFYAQIYQAITRHFDFDQLKVIIIASPGFTKEGVLQAIMDEAQRTNNKNVLTAKPKFFPEVSSQLKDTKFAREGLALSRFHKMLGSDELRAWYGESHVLKAIDRGAVGTLLISDALFKSSDFGRRQVFVKAVEDAKAFGAEVLIFSSMHESGEQLNNLSGMAAILSFPLDIELVEEEDRLDREAALAEEAKSNGDVT